MPAEKRASSFGLVTAAGSFGTFAVVPLIQWLIQTVSWQATLLYGAAVVAAIAPFALGFPRVSRAPEGPRSSDIEDDFSRLLSRAGRHSGYLLLNAGFFVCGFHVAFIATHLPPYLADHGLPQMIAATALALVGLFNMGDRGSSAASATATARSTSSASSTSPGPSSSAVSWWCPSPPAPPWSSPAPSASCGWRRCPSPAAWWPRSSGRPGSRLSTGSSSVSHQVGGFLGVWLGGRIHDATGSYDAVWVGAVVLGVAAAVVHLPIRDMAVGEVPATASA